MIVPDSIASQNAENYLSDYKIKCIAIPIIGEIFEDQKYNTLSESVYFYL